MARAIMTAVLLAAIAATFEASASALDLLCSANYEKTLPYDAEVEWLQSDGVAYVLAPYIPGARLGELIDTGVTVEISYPATPTARSHVMGYYVRSMGFGLDLATGNRYQCYPTATSLDYGSTWYYRTTFGVWNRIKVLADETTAGVTLFYVDDVLQARSIQSTSLARTDALYPIFAVATLSTNGAAPPTPPTSPGAIVRIRRFTATLAGDTVCDLIAVRKGTTGYFYDKISGNLYGNAAESGALLVGPDKAASSSLFGIVTNAVTVVVTGGAAK